MHIDSYQFGRVVIDSKSYTSDVLIVAEVVQSNWWRKQGHLLLTEDIEPILSAEPAVLVVGCGASGMMKIDKQVAPCNDTEYDPWVRLCFFTFLIHVHRLSFL